jgi:hypothetical protein
MQQANKKKQLLNQILSMSFIHHFTIASMPVPRMVFDKLIDVLAMVALAFSSSSIEGQTEVFCVELVKRGRDSSNDGPNSENTESAGIDEMEDAEVSLGSTML